MTWFSVPEDQFGAMGTPSRRFSLGGSGYAYQPVGGVESLEDVPHSDLEHQVRQPRWFGPAAPLVESELKPAGTDRLEGTITNRQSVPLEDAFLAYGKEVYLLGTIEPAASVRVELANDRNLSGHLTEGLQVYYRAALEPENFKIEGPIRLSRPSCFTTGKSPAQRSSVLGNGPLQASRSERPTGPQTPHARRQDQSNRSRLALSNAPRPQDRSVDVGPNHSTSQEETNQGTPR